MENSRQSMPIIFPYDPSEFWNHMRKLIREEMGKNIAPAPAMIEEPLLNRKELASRLQVSLVTLNDWVKRGLPCHKQRGRVYFLNSEVMNFIRGNKTKKPFPS